MKKRKIMINNHEYELIKEEQDCFNDDLLEKITDYFEPYDYIFGDFSYEKVRFKGYFDSKNKKATKINDIKYLDEYIKNYCSYGAKNFLLKKIK